jgi:hypothetical protein
MKNVQNLGKSLTRDEMKVITGGANQISADCNVGYCSKDCYALGCSHGYCDGGCFCLECPED